MAESYSNLFGTNGSGTQNRIGSMFGQQPTQQQQPRQPQPAQTFAQLQRLGQARPAPQAPQPNVYQPYQGSQQAQAARAPMLQAVQQQLAQPTRFDTQAFQQMRQAQAANLQSEFTEQQRQLNENLARRGVSASTIAASGFGRLAGAQSRALADIDAQLLQQAAQTQAQDRLAALQAGGQFAELAGAQDLAEFEARRVGQAQQFQEGLAAAQFGQGQSEFNRRMALEAAQAQQAGGFQGMDLELRRQLGVGGLGIQQQEVGLRAQQLQQEAATQGRQLSLAEAQFEAQSQLERERLQAQQQQFGITTAEQQRQFDIEQQLRQQLGMGGLNVQQQELALRAQQQAQQQQQFEATLSADERRFLGTLEEQRAARLQQFGLSTRELDQQAQRIQQDAALQGRSLDLQSARDQAEIGFRTQQLQQQAALQGRSLDLEQARQEATLAFQRDQLGVEEALRREGIAVDREGLAQRQQQFTADLALRGEMGRGELGIDRQRFQLQLAAALAPLPQAQRDLILRQIGMSPMPAVTGTPTPGSTPAGVPTSGQQPLGGLPPNEQEDLRQQLEEWFRNNPIGG